MAVEFETLVHGGLVEEAVKAQLQADLDTYLREAETQYGLTADSLPSVRGYDVTNEFERWNETQLPAVVIVSPGLHQTSPAKEGNGRYRCYWSVLVAVVVSANTLEATRRLRNIYTVAIRAAILQKPSLGGISQGIEWEDESYDDVEWEQSRSVSAGITSFVIETRDVTTTWAGPVSGDRVQVTDTSVTIIHKDKEPQP